MRKHWVRLWPPNRIFPCHPVECSVGSGVLGWQFCPFPLNSPLLASPHVSFLNLSRKGDGVRMGRDFSPTPRGMVGMGLDFLDSTRPTLIRVKL